MTDIKDTNAAEMQAVKHTPEQLAELRRQWGIPDNFVPVAIAPGVMAWATNASIAEAAGRVA